MKKSGSSERLPEFLSVDRSLGITGAWDVFHKFRWEFSQFRALSEVNHSLEPEDRIPLRHPMYAAVNTASTAWSLVEWIWREAHAEAKVLKRLSDLVGREAVETPRQLKEWMRKNDDLEACYQIAHQAKHGDMRKPNEKFSTNVKLWYPTGPDGSSGWRQNGYVVWQTETGAGESSINNVFARVLQHWDHTLDQLQIVERTIVIAADDD